MLHKMRVAVVGCGKISDIYLANLKRFENVDLVACADLVPERAAAKATEHGVGRACSVDELLADPSVEAIVNLTIPAAHASVAMAAINAGKHVHNEKPLTITCDEGQKLLSAAQAKSVRVGCAPDTFLGAGIQTCRKLIDDGAIGEPVAATAFMLCHGHEGWHPDPAFYYKVGGGPMFDMGPYYLTALVSLMGPVVRVTGATRKTFPTRTIASEPKKGQVITVDVPTHVTGILNFASGAIATIVTSFDIWGHNCPRLEVYGTHGSLSVPDPNTFGGPVKMSIGRAEWTDVPLTHGYEENSRGVGVADLAAAVAAGRPSRASGELAFHVLEIMHAIHQASDAGKHVEIQSTCQRPLAMPTGLTFGQMD